MTKESERLLRPAEELERLAEYYDTYDTGAEMEPSDWVEPQPMATTSLRLPVEVIEQLKRQARARHLRYTSYVRSILEGAAHGGVPPEIADITERLERIERAVTQGPSAGDQKTAGLAACEFMHKTSPRRRRKRGGGRRWVMADAPAIDQ